MVCWNGRDVHEKARRGRGAAIMIEVREWRKILWMMMPVEVRMKRDIVLVVVGVGLVAGIELLLGVGLVLVAGSVLGVALGIVSASKL